MALCAVGTAPNITAYLSRESVVQSVPTASPLTSCTRLSRSTRPLRPPASLLHNALFCEVVTSHCAGFVLCCLPLRALRVYKTGVMQSGLRWVCGWPVLWHQSGAAHIHLVSGLRPVMGDCPPAPPRGGTPSHRCIVACANTENIFSQCHHVCMQIWVTVITYYPSSQG